MTQVVTVHTDFSDLNQMAEGLIGRVNETHVILPTQEPVDVGAFAQFSVTLVDGTPAFAGRGRCVTFVDNGEERLPHQRFDVVFDSLEFDPNGEEIHQHILALSGSAAPDNDQAQADYPSDGAEGTSDVDAAEVTYSDSEYPDQAGYAGGEEDYGSDDEATVTGSANMVAELVENSRMQGGDDGYASVPATSLDDDDDLMMATNRPPVAANGASFHYPGGLPFPAKPPRPDLPASLRVTPAPRPQAEFAAAEPMQAQFAEESYSEESY